ncbi:MAG: four helix bundle protein [Bacteroidota bacterium]
MPNERYAQYLGSQLERSGTSPALNYAEASAAESLKDLLSLDARNLCWLKNYDQGVIKREKRGYVRIKGKMS